MMDTASEDENLNMRNSSMLPQFLERLLIKVCDGEASLLERCVGHACISLHEGCRQYSREMRILNDQLKGEVFGVEARPSVNLWDKIERRIEEEERAAIYLGKREVMIQEEESRAPWFKEIFNPGVFGGMAVGLATATVAFVVFSKGPVSPAGVDNLASRDSSIAVIDSQRNTAEGVDFVTYSNNQDRRRLMSREAFRSQQQMRALKRMDSRIPFEVDWMRSDGHVSFIQDPKERSTVIWVKRSNSNPNRPRVLEAEPKIIETVR